METLKILNNVQKAKLLHNLMITEIPAFIDYLNEQATTVLASAEELKANWEGQMFGADFWIGLADDVLKKTTTQNKEIKRSANAFADQLFEGYLAIFTIHVLTYFIANETAVDVKFKQAVELLFT